MLGQPAELPPPPNREALQELQARLAERMREAEAQPAAVSWLAVEAGGQGFLFPLHQAGEIFPASAVLKLPYTQPWFVGVANLRGSLIAVVDWALFLGLRPRPAVVEGGREQARLLALSPALGSQCALRVDKLAGLRHAPQLQAVVSQPNVHPRFAPMRWRDEAGRIWQEIDLVALTQQTSFLAVAQSVSAGE